MHKILYLYMAMDVSWTYGDHLQHIQTLNHYGLHNVIYTSKYNVTCQL